jgi:hypothetical protein
VAADGVMAIASHIPLGSAAYASECECGGSQPPKEMHMSRIGFIREELARVERERDTHERRRVALAEIGHGADSFVSGAEFGDPELADRLKAECERLGGKIAECLRAQEALRDELRQERERIRQEQPQQQFDAGGATHEECKAAAEPRIVSQLVPVQGAWAVGPDFDLLNPPPRPTIAIIEYRTDLDTGAIEWTEFYPREQPAQAKEMP